MTLTNDNGSSRPRLILITGIMAAGKSTIAQQLAERLPRSVHLRGDVFRRMIVNGRAEMDVNLSHEAYQQLQLRYHLARAVVDLYIEAGFTVVYQDIIIGHELAEAVHAYDHHALSVIVLCPSPDAVAARDAKRGKTAYREHAMVNAFDHVLRTDTPRVGWWLDTSNLTVDETVDHIVVNLEVARVNTLDGTSWSAAQERSSRP